MTRCFTPASFPGLRRIAILTRRPCADSRPGRDGQGSVPCRSSRPRLSSIRAGATGTTLRRARDIIVDRPSTTDHSLGKPVGSSPSRAKGGPHQSNKHMLRYERREQGLPTIRPHAVGPRSRMSERMASISTGLTKWCWNPASRDRFRACSLPYPETAIKRASLQHSSFRSVTASS